MSAAEPASVAALDLRRSLGDADGAAAALINLGLIAYDRGDFPTARSRTTEALEIARELGNDYRVAGALCNLGGILVDEGDPAGAIPLVEESIGLADPAGDGYGSAAARENLVAALLGTGDLDRAGAVLGGGRRAPGRDRRPRRDLGRARPARRPRLRTRRRRHCACGTSPPPTRSGPRSAAGRRRVRRDAGGNVAGRARRRARR